MNDYVVPQQLLRSILDYLSQRPYGEVFQLIQGIQSVKVVEPVKQEGTKNESGN